MRLDHPIFNEPLDAGVVLEDNKWEREYDASGVWLVQTGKVGAEVDFGVVSNGYGFEDSPDCERISGGINTKGPQAVAIGRQANMLQWGFYAAPDRMTRSGQRAFLNALVYMQAFDGQRPLVRRVHSSREALVQVIGMLKHLDGEDGKRNEGLERYITSCFPADLVAKHGLDREALTSWHREHIEYFRYEGRGPMKVDTDLLKLGISNRQPAFLDLVITRLTTNPADPLALTLCERYLDPEALGDSQPLPWLHANRSKLFFSDIGGFRWFLNDQPVARKPAKVSPSD